MDRRKIIFLSFSLIFFSTLGVLFAYNWQIRQDLLTKFKVCDDDWCIHFYGNVDQEMFVGISYLLNDTFERVENVPFHQVNMYNNTMDYNVSGVKLWDIISDLRILTSEAKSFRFEAIDGYVSYELPIEILRNFPDRILIITHINGKLIPPQEEGGSGPLKVAVFMDAIADNPEIEATFEKYNQEFVHNSKFSVKYLNMIQFF